MDNLEDLWNLKEELTFPGKKGSSEGIFENKKDGLCSKCRGRGYFVKDNKTIKCDVCNGLPLKEDIVELSDEELYEKVKKLGIPEFYWKREFEADKLKKDENLPLEVRKDSLMEFYIRSLNKIYDHFVLNKKLPNSYIVMAPQGNAKSHLVYLSMIEAVKKQLTVAPYYDTNDISNMFYNNSIDLDIVFNADIAFIKIIPAFVTKTDTQAVKLVLDKRAKKGLPTIVISRFNMGYLKEIEPHLIYNFGLKNVEEGDYSKLKEVLGVYKSGSSNNQYNNNNQYKKQYNNNKYNDLNKR